MNVKIAISRSEETRAQRAAIKRRATRREIVSTYIGDQPSSPPKHSTGSPKGGSAQELTVANERLALGHSVTSPGPAFTPSSPRSPSGNNMLGMTSPGSTHPSSDRLMLPASPSSASAGGTGVVLSASDSSPDLRASIISGRLSNMGSTMADDHPSENNSSLGNSSLGNSARSSSLSNSESTSPLAGAVSSIFGFGNSLFPPSSPTRLSRSQSDATLLSSYNNTLSGGLVDDAKSPPPHLSIPSSHLAAGLLIGSTTAMLLSPGGGGNCGGIGGVGRSVAVGGAVGVGTVYGVHGLHGALQNY